jgi:hypothetical protein
MKVIEITDHEPVELGRVMRFDGSKLGLVVNSVVEHISETRGSEMISQNTPTV